MSNYNCEILNKDESNHIFFSGDIENESAHKFCYELNKLELYNKPIYIHLYSDGGRCNAGLRMYDAIKLCSVKTIVIAEGWVASSGTLVLCAADIKVATKNTYFLIHEFSSCLDGTYTNIKSKTNYHNLLLNTILNIYKENTKITYDDIKFDNYLNSQQALDLQLISHII